MTKSEAAQIFGGAYADLARALDISRAGVSQWPDELSQAQIDRVIGAAGREAVVLLTAGRAGRVVPHGF